MSATQCQCPHHKLQHKDGYGPCFSCACKSFRSEDALGCHPPVNVLVPCSSVQGVTAGVYRKSSGTLVWSCGHAHRACAPAHDCLRRFLRQRAKDVAACTQANCLKG